MFEPINRQVKQLTGIPGPSRRPTSGSNIQFLIYGKIIIDNIRLLDGTVVRSVIGGGGPQGAIGARLWNDSVGLLSRSGEDIEEGPAKSLLDLDIDLSGWMKYPSLRTLRGAMVYDEKQQMIQRRTGGPGRKLEPPSLPADPPPGIVSTAPSNSSHQRIL